MDVSAIIFLGIQVLRLDGLGGFYWFSICFDKKLVKPYEIEVFLSREHNFFGAVGEMGLGAHTEFGGFCVFRARKAPFLPLAK